MSHNLTDEQSDVVCSSAKTMVVNAYAGTGKTSVLVEYAKRRPNSRMLYLAFNRSIKEEASRRFPRNVRCVTTHGLAYAGFGAQFKDKLGNPKAFHVAKALDLSNVDAGRVLVTVTAFLTSGDREIGERHAAQALSRAKPEELSDLIIQAKRAWAAMRDLTSPVPMPHDGYLKLYQLSNPRIDADVILFDEAQDANPVTLDIVQQQSCGKVFVGDRFQSIYQFRGAVNALAEIQADEYLDLTASFRFGAGVASIASGLLMDFCGAVKPVRGFGEHATVFTVDQSRPHAILARTNGRLFTEAVRLLQDDAPFGFAGGVAGYRMELVLDVFRLYAHRVSEIKDPFLRSFKSFQAMCDYADELDDKELKSMAGVVDEYRFDIPKLVQEITTRAIEPLTGNEVVLSTAHKAKGLEWLDVVLLDDFVDLEPQIDDDGFPVGPDPDEVNILYVAVTRALRGLCLPPNVRDWLIRSSRWHLIA